MRAMRSVASGFKLVYTGLMLKVLAVVIGIVGAVVLVGGAVNAGPGAVGGLVGGALVLIFGVAALGLAGTAVEIVGRIKCLAVPEEVPSARPLILAAVSLQIISFLIQLLALINDLAGPFVPPNVQLSLNGVYTIFWIASEVVFLLFIKAVATFVRRRDLAATASSILALAVVMIVLYVISLVLVFMSVARAGGGGMVPAAGGGAVAGILGLVLFVLGIITLIRYANLLLAMQAACNKFASRGDLGDYEDDEYERPRRRRDDDDEDDRQW